MHGVFTTVFFLLTARRQVSTLEIQGTIVVVLGGALMILDPEAHKVGEEANYMVSLISCLANIPGALFWATNKILDNKISIFNMVFM